MNLTTEPSREPLSGPHTSVTNLFGTDGIRGTAGKGLFVEEKLLTIGKAIARWACMTYGANPKLLLVHDTRISAGFVKSALKTGLLQFPLTIVDAGVLPTPAAAHLMNEQSRPFHAALIISASHNPYQDNGIKIMDAATGKLSLADELIISELIMNGVTPRLQSYGHEEENPQAAARYCAQLTAHFTPNILAGKTIVLDTANGATFQIAPTVFTTLGAHVITINNTPNGSNINEQCGALHLEQLQKAVLEHDADIGFAFDGDGDRVMAVNAQGQIKDGDDILALLLTHPDYQATRAVVGTVMSNEGFARFLQTRGKMLIRAKVGDKYVAEQLATERLLLGGEPSGHIILRNIIGTGDGILVALKVLETIVQTGNTTFETFTKYPQAMKNITVTTKHDLSKEPFATKLEAVQNTLPAGRILVRYSGTEPVLRIMTEADTVEHAQAACQELAHYFSQL